MVSASVTYPFSSANSYDASISADGRFVAFTSRADNVIDDGVTDTNGTTDVFVRDLLLSSTVRVSLTAADHQSSGWSSEPEISPDGHFVVFVSDATDVTTESNGRPAVYLRRVPIGS
jgi:Tol biopolymer transport system component